MDCEQFGQIVEELERELPMQASARAEGLKHAEHCFACRVRLAEFRLLTLELRALAKHDELLQAPAHLETRLTTAFREQARRSSRFWGTLAWGTVVAALVLIGWLLGAHLWQRHLQASSARVNTHVAVPTGAAQRSPLRLESNSGRSLRAAHKKRKTVAKHVSLAAGASAESEAANGFVALPYGDSDYAEGAGMMVRVQLPRSAPAMVGLPMIPGSETSGPVTADVVIGQDGVARAIRFVSPDEGGALPRNMNFNQDKDQGEPQ